MERGQDTEVTMLPVYLHVWGFGFECTRAWILLCLSIHFAGTRSTYVLNQGLQWFSFSFHFLYLNLLLIGLKHYLCLCVGKKAGIGGGRMQKSSKAFCFQLC